MKLFTTKGIKADADRHSISSGEKTDDKEDKNTEKQERSDSQKDT